MLIKRRSTDARPLGLGLRNLLAVLILTVVFFIVLMSIPVSGHLGSTAIHGS